MPVLPIVISGHPALHTRAQRVTAVTSDTRQLVTDLVDTMHAAPGVGLAAPQVGASVRIFVWHFDDGDTIHEGHVLNPRLVVSGWPRHRFFGEPEEEGCLSLPGLRAPLARFPRARLTGEDLEGNPVEVSADGWLARIFQHEYDHTRGVIYPDRLPRRLRQATLADASDHSFGIALTQWTPGQDGEESDFAVGEDDG